MAMSMKEKLFIVWILAVVAFGFLFRHFWSWTVCALEKVVALSVIPVPGLVKAAAGICCVNFLP
jgi:hypothetical protein